ncbi:g4241 [Coccomyxa viridis]|uniref:G4241 protein n=1 Tax=Coccomyxa viridis TaxID=1274662 RepID=A0ABP1FPT2_9CHLO
MEIHSVGRGAPPAETSGRPIIVQERLYNVPRLSKKRRTDLRQGGCWTGRQTEARQSVAARASQALGDWFFTESGQKDWVEAMELRSIAPDLPALLAEMGVSYDPDRLSQALKGREIEISARAVKVATMLGACIAAVAKDYTLGQLEQNEKLRARQLCKTLSQLGPSFVKIGQALSSRPDLLPQIYLETLSELQDRLPPFPTEIALQLIEEDLGVPASAIMSTITPEPVAAASLGQVYKGRLKSTGEEVALKVQRPGIGEQICIDMVLLRRLMMTVDSTLPKLRLPIQIQPLTPLVDEFAGRLFGELDYIQEGLNAERFQELYGNVPRIRTPRIMWAHTARRVLCMEWIDGVKLTDKAAMAAAGLDIIDFVDVGIECTLRQLLESGLFHADPHPGNLLATPAGDLCYLDFGMMSEAPENARYAIIAHVVHLVNRDYEAMCRDYYTLDFMDRSVDTSPIAPALAEFFDDVLDRSVSQLNFKAIVDGLGGVLFKFPFRVPAYYALILRSLTVLEGLALQADRNYKLLGKAYPYMAKRLLIDPAPELRESFRELVLTDSGRVRWNRIENLVEESSKSVGYDQSQLWKVADWIFGDPGEGVRKPVAAELARLIDSAVAEEVRARLLRQTNNPQLVQRLAPMQAGEAEAARRARSLWASLAQNMDARSQPLLQGSIGSIPDAGQLVQQVQGQLQASWPQLQTFMDMPGAIEMRAELLANLSRRFFARTIKMIFGPQAPRESSRQSAFTASNPRSAALQRAATAQVRAGGTDAGASLSSPTVTTLPASLAQATVSEGNTAAVRRGNTAASQPRNGSSAASPTATLQMSRQRMVNLAALGEPPLPVLARPVEVEIVD